MTPGNGIHFEYGYDTDVGGESYTFPDAWLELTRFGNTITAYSSADGTTWTEVGTTTISLTDPVTIGLFTTSHNASTPQHGHLRQRERHLFVTGKRLAQGRAAGDGSQEHPSPAAVVSTDRSA